MRYRPASTAPGRNRLGSEGRQAAEGAEVLVAADGASPNAAPHAGQNRLSSETGREQALQLTTSGR